MRRPTPVQQQRALNTRLRLIRAASDLFDRNGFAGTNIGDIANTADVTKGSVYFHFTAKLDLVEAVEAQASELLADASRTLADEEQHTVQLLINLSHLLADWLSTESVMRSSFRLAREHGDAGRPFINFWLDFANTTHSLVDCAHQVGELTAGATPRSATTLVLATSLGTEQMWASGLAATELSRAISDHWRLIIPGLVRGELVNECRPDGNRGF